MIPRHTPTLRSSVPGFTSDELLGFIYDCVIAQRPKYCIEIGTFMGRSASVICRALAELGGERRLYCIDFHLQAYSEAYLARPFMQHMINRCGPEVKKAYTDFAKLRTLGDCFNLSVVRTPELKQYAELIKANSLALDFSSIPRVDFAYIDGGHEYDEVRSDTKNVLSRLNRKGMIVFDDYIDAFPGVVSWVDEFKASMGVECVGREAGDVAFIVEDPSQLRHQFWPDLQG